MHQFVTLTRGGQQVKQSTRRATYVTVDELVDEVGADVFRFFMVERKADGHLDFDLDLAKDQDWKKNPAYYVQYAHARTHGIERKAARGGRADAAGRRLRRARRLVLPEEIELMKKLVEFPEMVARAARAPRAASRRLLPARGRRALESLPAGRRSASGPVRGRGAHGGAARSRARRAHTCWRTGWRCSASARRSGCDGARRRRAKPGPEAAQARPTLLSALFAARGCWVVLGFALGIVAGLMLEEPQLLLDYVTGRTTSARSTHAARGVRRSGRQRAAGVSARRRTAAFPRPPRRHRPLAAAPPPPAAPSRLRSPRPCPAPRAADTGSRRAERLRGAGRRARRFGERRAARREARERGFAVYVTPSAGAGARRWRVRVGPVRDARGGAAPRGAARAREASDLGVRRRPPLNHGCRAAEATLARDGRGRGARAASSRGSRRAIRTSSSRARPRGA